MIRPSPGPAARRAPVLYLDLDDTIVRWVNGEPEAAPGAAEFLRWALDHMEVRWLTTWAPHGRMPTDLLADLASLTGLPAARLSRIPGLGWEGGSKLDGIAWLEHVVEGRAFYWLEDDKVPPETVQFLERHGYQECFRSCNVTREPDDLRRRHDELRRGLERSGPALARSDGGRSAGD